MSRTQKWFTAAIVLLALIVVVVVAILAGPQLQRAVFYPEARGLPPVVTAATEQLLDRLQAVLETNAPIVAQALQPGLSEAEIAALESKGGFRLSPDLRALYRWHNGMGTNHALQFLPGHWFVPLDELVKDRAITGQQLAAASGLQRTFFAVFAGHTKEWLRVLDDGAGDGYFFDLQRTDAEGAFFFHFAEDSYYIWFPSVRNFLAGVIECYETGAVKVGSDGQSLEENAEQSQQIWEKLGKSNQSEG